MIRNVLEALAEVVNEHDVAFGYVVFGVEDITSIRRDSNAKVSLFAFHDWADFLVREIEKAQGGNIVGGIEVDAFAANGPVVCEGEPRNSFDARLGTDRVQRSCQQGRRRVPRGCEINVWPSADSFGRNPGEVDIATA
jgi:hypothetical protein